MIIGTAFTLFIVPSIYMLLAHTRSVEVTAEESIDDFGADLAVVG
jgi:hypothetical protein